MFIATVIRLGHSLAFAIPARIHRGWRITRGQRLIIEQTEPGRATFRPLVVNEYDPLAGQQPKPRRNRRA